MPSIAALGRSTLTAISGTAFFASDLDVGNAVGILHHRARVLRQPARIVEIVAANFELQPARAAVVVLAAAAEEPHDLVVAARRIGADDDARQCSTQLPAQRDGDLLVRALR